MTVLTSTSFLAPSMPLWVRAAACVLVMAPSAAQASELAWETVKSRGGVEVQQADMEGSPIKITRGSMVSKARMFDVLAVLQDIESCQQWLHKCKEGRVIDKPAVNQAINYTVIDSPLMLKDRDSYIHSTVSYDAQSRVLRIDMVGVEDAAPPEKKKVRMLKFRGHWLLESRDDNTTFMTYQTHVDPQVAATGAANSTLATSVLETLRKVSKLAQKPPYVNSEAPKTLLDRAETLKPEGQ